jgi:hypothetical protein
MSLFYTEFAKDALEAVFQCRLQIWFEDFQICIHFVAIARNSD